MDRKANGHSAEYIKRQAKKIKKDSRVLYIKALDKAAINAGFSGLANFLNESSPSVAHRRTYDKMSSVLPSPSVLTFYPALSTIRHLRPNKKVPVSVHQKLGNLLKILKNATEDHKRANKPIKEVAHMLDEWVQREYTNSKEMSDEVFFELYYGDEGTEAENAPTEKRKKELTILCQKAKVILTQNYHDCGPLRVLLSKLDLAIKWMPTWPAIKPFRQHGRIDTVIPRGTLVLIKSNRRSAILVSHQNRNHIVICYSDSGTMTTARHEIIVPKDQSGLRDFKPMRLWLPYGKWLCEDGTEVLFNRDYCPLWAKEPNGKVIALYPDVWVERNSKSEYFFDDGTAPWRGNKKTLAECIKVLEDWGVENHISGPLSLLKQAIAKGDTSLLKPKHVGNYFSGLNSIPSTNIV